MTLSDPNPGFKVTVYLQVEYLKKRCVWDKVRKLYKVYRMAPLTMTLSDL